VPKLRIDFCFDCGLCLFRGSRVAEFKQASEAPRDGAPMLAVLPGMSQRTLSQLAPLTPARWAASRN